MRIIQLHINPRKPSNLSGWRLFPLVSLICVLAFTGCSQDAENMVIEVPETNQPGGNADSDEPVIIGVSVDAVDDYYGGAVTRTGKTIEKIVQPLDSTRDTGYNIETTIESIPLDNPIQTRGTLSNVVFRVYAYRGATIDATSEGNYAGSAAYTIDSSGKATIVSGTAEPANSVGEWTLSPGTYSFAFYSCGSDKVPDVLYKNWSINVGHKWDFMISQKPGIQVTAGSDGIFTLTQVNFQRLCSRLQCVVQATGFSDNRITKCQAQLKDTNWDRMSWNPTVTEFLLTSSDGILYTTWPSLDSDIITSDEHYVMPQNPKNMILDFTSIKIGSTEFVNKIKVSIRDMGFEVKRRYKIKVVITEHTVWAPGNLVKSGNTYTFAGKTEYGSYFGWNTLDDSTGANNAGDYSKGNDPCTKVSPAGTWVTPTQAQLQKLIDSGSSWTVRGRQFGGKYSDVFLPAAGYRNSDGFMKYVGRSGFYWSSTPYGIYGYGLTIDSEGTYLNYDSDRNSSFSVRCVKE